MSVGRTFTVDIERAISPAALRWLTRDDDPREGLGLNRHYRDMRGFKWPEVLRTVEIERAVLEELEDRQFDPDDESETIALDIVERSVLFGLDLGVASSVLALSAARCVPFQSCNAGAFGGAHLESYPLVAFYLRPQLAPLILRCAERADVGLLQDEHGQVQVYANDVACLIDFAEECYDTRKEIAAVRLR